MKPFSKEMRRICKKKKNHGESPQTYARQDGERYFERTTQSGNQTTPS